jgi:hypothetical protein
MRQQLKAAMAWLVVCGVAPLSFAQQPPSQRSDTKSAAMDSIRIESVRAHMRFLSDGLLKGRNPGSSEYEIAAHYVASQLESIGIQPAGENSTWFQRVPFRKATPDDNKSSVVLFNPTQQLALKPHEGFWFYRDLVRTESDVEAPVVFVGYGITAPELNYDDYAGIDGRGKIVAFINNAPATFPTSPAAYYANHVQKMSAAVDHGAIGFLMIRLPGDDSDPAGTGEWLKSDGSPQDTFPQIRAWAELTQAAAEILMQGSPKSLPQVLAAARAGEHQSFPLAWSARMHSVNVHQRLEAFKCGWEDRWF